MRLPAERAKAGMTTQHGCVTAARMDEVEDEEVRSGSADFG